MEDKLVLSGKMHDPDSLLGVLMRRDGLTRCEANEAIEEAKERVLAGEDLEEVLAEEFGLEPDYIYDLMD